MTKKEFILHTLIKIVIMVVVTVTVFTVIQSPTITNDIAMGQLENSNELYIQLELYNKWMPIVRSIYYTLMCGIGLTIMYDIYRYLRKRKDTI